MEPNRPSRVRLVPFVHSQSYKRIRVHLDPNIHHLAGYPPGLPQGPLGVPGPHFENRGPIGVQGSRFKVPDVVDYLSEQMSDTTHYMEIHSLITRCVAYYHKMKCYMNVMLFL